MANAKNQKLKIKKTKPRVAKSYHRPAKHNKNSRRRSNFLHRQKIQPLVLRNTISTVIILSMILVVLSLFFQFFSDPRKKAEQTLSSIASDYYENYFYETVVSANSIDAGKNVKTLNEIMAHYETVGFAKITLRQLSFFKPEKYTSAIANLTHYCDENDTFIRIFPHSPFSNTDYHIDYSYSCAF